MLKTNTVPVMSDSWLACTFNMNTILVLGGKLSISLDLDHNDLNS